MKTNIRINNLMLRMKKLEEIFNKLESDLKELDEETENNIYY